MHLLALETSTLRASLAVQKSDGIRELCATDPSQRHGRELLPAIEAMLQRVNLSAKNLDVIAVGLGPGSYTGLRVGVTAAKTLAYAIGAKLVGLDSLEFFARSLPARVGRLCVIADAQRGEFHLAEFFRSSETSELSRIAPTRTSSSFDLEASWTEPTMVTGPGLSRWPREWPPHVEVLLNDQPDPSALLDMAIEAVRLGQFANLSLLEPIYLRASAAEDLWKARRDSPSLMLTPPKS